MKRLTCQERDDLLGDGEGWHIEAGLTDPHGDFGMPTIMTEWGRNEERLKDVRHPHYGEFAPGPKGDRRPCEHYYWKEQDDEQG